MEPQFRQAPYHQNHLVIVLFGISLPGLQTFHVRNVYQSNPTAYRGLPFFGDANHLSRETTQTIRNYISLL